MPGDCKMNTRNVGTKSHNEPVGSMKGEHTTDGILLCFNLYANTKHTVRITRMQTPAKDNLETTFFFLNLDSNGKSTTISLTNENKQAK